MLIDCDLPNYVRLENIWIIFLWNRRTPQPKANPTREILVKVAFGPLFPTANNFSWVGIGLCRKQTTRNPTQPNSEHPNVDVNVIIGCWCQGIAECYVNVNALIRRYIATKTGFILLSPVPCSLSWERAGKRGGCLSLFATSCNTTLQIHSCKTFSGQFLSCTYTSLAQTQLDFDPNHNSNPNPLGGSRSAGRQAGAVAFGSAARFGGVVPTKNGRPKGQPRPIRQSGVAQVSLQGCVATISLHGLSYRRRRSMLLRACVLFISLGF